MNLQILLDVTWHVIHIKARKKKIIERQFKAAKDAM
jgi:hypothetical protein